MTYKEEITALREMSNRCRKEGWVNLGFYLFQKGNTTFNFLLTVNDGERGIRPLWVIHYEAGTLPEVTI